MAYEIQLKGTEAEVVDADGYVQEGVLTTFFQGRDGRAVARLVGQAHRQLPHRGHHPHPLDRPGRRAGDLSPPMFTQLKAS